MTTRTAKRAHRGSGLPAAQLPDFTPVPRQCERHDGWTPERQRAFIEALADTGSVQSACRAVGMSQRGAYHLRRQPGAASFRKAWLAAIDCGVWRLEDTAMDRALNGVEEQRYTNGELVSTRTRYNDRLLMFMLRARAPERYAHGGGAKGMNAADKMDVARIKKQFQAEWAAEAAQARNVSAAEVRASIDRKIAEVRIRCAYERDRQWAKLSEETRAAWAQFVALRDRDLDAEDASPEERALVDVGPVRTRSHWIPPVDLTPRERKTEWGLKDEGW